MSILLKIEAKLEAINKRLEAAQRQIQTIIVEKRKLDNAYAVVTEVLEDDGNGVQSQNDSSELTGPKLIMKILEESPRSLRSGEIRDIAQKEYGREIPRAPVNAALAYAKRSGRITNSDGLWSIVSPQPERPDPVERSEADDLAVL